MNKYSLENLDNKMVFDQAIFQRLSGCIPFSCRLKRLDDFELSMEVDGIQETSILPLHEVLNAAMSMIAEHLWNTGRYHFMNMPFTDIPFNRKQPVSIDIILIKSSSSEIKAEFFVYQGHINLFDAELTIESL